MRINQMLKAIKQDKPAKFFSLWASSTPDSSIRPAILQNAEEQWGPGNWMVRDLHETKSASSQNDRAEQEISKISRIPYADVVLKEVIASGSYSMQVWKAEYQKQTVVVKQTPWLNWELLEPEVRFLIQARSNYVIGFVGIQAGAGSKRAESLVLKYAGGGSLYKTLQDSKISISPIQKLNWAKQCGEAVSYIHYLGIIHFDLKTPNFVLDNGRLKLIDFAVAKTLGSPPLERGNCAWAPPERYHTHPSCDVFSLGVVLFEILTRRFPLFYNDKWLADLVTHHHPIPFPQETPPVFKLTISACLHLDPDKRPTAQWVRNQFHWALKSLESISPTLQNKKRKTEGIEEKSVIRISPMAPGGRGILLSPALLLYLLDFLTIGATMSYIRTNRFNHKQFTSIKKSWLLQKIHHHFPRDYDTALQIGSAREMVRYYRDLHIKHYGEKVSIFHLFKEHRMEEAITKMTALFSNISFPEEIYHHLDDLFIKTTDIEGNTLINWANKFSEQKFLDHCFQNFICATDSPAPEEEASPILQYGTRDRMRAGLHKNQLTLPALCLFAVAFTCRQSAICQEIVESPAWRPGFIHTSGWSLLTWAVLLNNEDLLRFAFKGPDAEEIQKMLMSTVHFPRIGIFEGYIEENLTVNPIQLAMALNKKSLVEYCFNQDWGRDPGLLDPGLNYYLHLSIVNDDQKTVQELLLKKADPNGEEKNRKRGCPPLTAAAAAQSSTAIVRMLLEFKADLSEPRNKNYHFLLVEAVSRGPLETVECLIKQRTALTRQQNSNHDLLNTLLDRAMLSNQWSVVKYLIDQKADLNVTLENEKSLSWAVLRRKIKMFNYLLAAGAAPGYRELDEAVSRPNSKILFLVCFYVDKNTVQDYIARTMSDNSHFPSERHLSNIRDLTQKYGLNPQTLFAKLKPAERALLESPKDRVSGDLPGTTTSTPS